MVAVHALVPHQASPACGVEEAPRMQGTEGSRACGSGHASVAAAGAPDQTEEAHNRCSNDHPPTPEASQTHDATCRCRKSDAWFGRPARVWPADPPCVQRRSWSKPRTLSRFLRELNLKIANGSIFCNGTTQYPERMILSHFPCNMDGGYGVALFDFRLPVEIA